MSKDAQVSDPNTNVSKEVANLSQMTQRQAEVFELLRGFASEPMVDYASQFRRKQLQPISSLLEAEQLLPYQALVSGLQEIGFEDYKPFRSGGGRLVEHVPPKESEDLAAFSLPELWRLPHDWQPKDNGFGPAWWIREDIDALASKFAELVEGQIDEQAELGTQQREYRRRFVGHS